MRIWPNRDLIGQSGGINVYAYVGNGPVGGVDPSGLEVLGIPDAFWVGAGVAALIVCTAGTAAPVIVGAFVVGAGTGALVGHYGRDHEEWGDAIHNGAGGAAVGTLVCTTFRPFTMPNQLVSQWTPAGAAGGVAGGWVMTGPPNLRNYIFSGVWQPNYGYPFSNCSSAVVPGSSLSYPPGWEWPKGWIGQRILTLTGTGGCGGP